MKSSNLKQPISRPSGGLVDAIRKYGPDTILVLGDAELDQELYAIPSNGCWYFRFGDQPGDPGTWMDWLGMCGGAATIKATLEAKGGPFNDAVELASGCFRIKPHCIGSSIDTMLNMVVDWPSKCLLRQQRNGDSNHSPVVDVLPPKSTNKGIWQLLSMLMQLFIRMIKRPFEDVQWMIGVIDRPIKSILQDQSLDAVRWLTPKGNPGFVADPFAIASDKKMYVFHERLDVGARNGVIAVFDTDLSGSSASTSDNVIELDAHLSYPYLIQHKGKTFCVPECAQSRELAIYEAVEFPTQWRKVSALLPDIELYDATIFQYDGHWWLFGSGPEDSGQLTLRIWYAEDLFGPWSPHLENPVKIDVRSARPAGTPFEHEGHWYRPAQDCSETYGGAVVLNRIEELSPSQFRESFAASVKPRPDWHCSDGLHTLSAVGDRTLIDAKHIFYSFSAFSAHFRRK